MDSVHVSDLPSELVERFPIRSKLRLSIEIVLVYCRVRLRLWRHDFPTVLAELRRGRADPPPAPESAVTYLRAARLAWAVQRTLKLFPTDSRCLMQSLVLTTMLAKRGIDSALLIGVKPGEEFEAHAWIEYCGRPLLPDSQDSFQPLSSL